MSLCFRLLLVVLLLVCHSPLRMVAQQYSDREVFISWEDFMTEYLEDAAERSDATDEPWQLQNLIDEWEQYRDAPLNLNTATRSALTDLHLLNSDQIDSLLAYRQRLRRFTSLGDLMLVRQLDFRQRRWLSLFVYVGDTLRPKTTLRKLLVGGQHRLDFRHDQPLYRRQGFLSTRPDGTPQPTSQRYLGAPSAQTLRYRYHLGHRIAYGLTLQRDVGEPMLAYGNGLADASSAYVKIASSQGRWQAILGDFELHLAQGLVMGQAWRFSPFQVLQGSKSQLHRFRPHTSQSEALYQRGAAFAANWRALRLLVFASHRKVDANIENDSVRTYYRSGLHRTLSELRSKSTLPETQLGFQIGYATSRSALTLNLATTSHPLVYAPPPRSYNRFASQGTGAFALSLGHSHRQRHWAWEGEFAVDQRGNIALSEQAQWQATTRLRLATLLRHFATAYLAPQGKTWQQATHVQNEQGALFSAQWQLSPKAEVSLFADLYRFPAPSYRAAKAALGMESGVQWQHQASATSQQSLRYRFVTQQQNLANHVGVLEHVSTHHLRLAQRWQFPNLTLHLAIDVSAHSRASQPQPQWGTMLSSRCQWQAHRQFRLSAFAALFRTANYATRLYAYTPQLDGMGGFPSFAYRGGTLVLQAMLRPWSPVALSMRLGLLRYFDRDAISSGAQRINAPTQADLSLLMSYRF